MSMERWKRGKGIVRALGKAIGQLKNELRNKKQVLLQPSPGVEVRVKLQNVIEYTRIWCERQISYLSFHLHYCIVALNDVKLNGMCVYKPSFFPRTPVEIAKSRYRIC